MARDSLGMPMIDPPSGWTGQGGVPTKGITTAPPRPRPPMNGDLGVPAPPNWNPAGNGGAGSSSNANPGGTSSGGGTTGGPIVRPPVWGGPAIDPGPGWTDPTKQPGTGTPSPGGGTPGVPVVPGVPASPAQPSIADYMSPYTDAVLQSGLDNLNKVGMQRRNQLGTEAFQSGAYGDARHGVEDANLTTDLATAAGNLTSSVNADAFDKAMGWNNTDIDRQLGIQLDNANLQGQYLDRGTGLYQNALTNSSNYADALLGLDQYDQGQQQNQLNAQYEDWLAQQGYDQSQLSQFLNTINGTPGQTGSSTSTPNNQWANMLAAALGNINFGGASSGGGTGVNGSAHLFGN